MPKKTDRIKLKVIRVPAGGGAHRLYISRSYRDASGRSTTKNYACLGRDDAIAAREGRDAMEWAREQAALMEAKLNEGVPKEVSVRLRGERLPLGEGRPSVNVGYLFVQQALFDLGVGAECDRIQSQHRFGFDLKSVVAMLVAQRVLEPASKLSSYGNASKTLEGAAGFPLQAVYRALDYLAGHSDRIQRTVYRRSRRLVDRDCQAHYYDCTTFSFHSDRGDDDVLSPDGGEVAERGLRKEGYSKEGRRVPIVQMGLLSDIRGIPVACRVFPGDTSEKVTLVEMVELATKEFGIRRMVVCTDAAMSSHENRKYNDRDGRMFVTVCSRADMSAEQKEWAVSPDGWTDGRAGLKVESLDPDGCAGDAFLYKSTVVDYKGVKQCLVSVFSAEQRARKNALMQKALDGAEKAVRQSRGAALKQKYVKTTAVTADGEVADRSVAEVDYAKAEKEKEWNGFITLTSNIANGARAIMSSNAGRWVAEDCFRFSKTDIEAMPVFLSSPKRIVSHFLICELALCAFRVLRARVNHGLPEDWRFTEEELLKAIRGMDVHEIDEGLYVPAFTRSAITDRLQEQAHMPKQMDVRVMRKSDLMRNVKQSRKGYPGKQTPVPFDTPPVEYRSIREVEEEERKRKESEGKA